MKESNISRDHIAMEAMKELLKKAPVEISIWQRIKVLFFGGCYGDIPLAATIKDICEWAYKIADAMIEERNKKED